MKGISLLERVVSVDEAIQIAERHCATYGNTNNKFLGCENVSLLSSLAIPGSDLDDRHYQCLHFDGGLPILPKQSGPVTLVTALYFPLDGTPGTASTRFVNLRDIAQKAHWGPPETIEQKFIAYWEKLGSSWNWSDTESFRESCFARILDALEGQGELTNFRDTPKELWSTVSCQGNEFPSLEDECEFFRKHGLVLDDITYSITLQPGQLLLFDNLRLIHGRIGSRRKHEVVQMSFGVKNMDIINLNAIAQYFIRWLSS